MESIMNQRYSHYRHRYEREARPVVERARAYLSTRPTESWLFFAAGFLAATILG